VYSILGGGEAAGGEVEGGQFGQPGHRGGVAPGGVTPGLGQVTNSGVGTAVSVVLTAHRLQGRRRRVHTPKPIQNQNSNPKQERE
jgi:hypothetical protein